jgi:hypothetical protein
MAKPSHPSQPSMAPGNNLIYVFSNCDQKWAGSGYMRINTVYPRSLHRKRLYRLHSLVG